MVVVAEGAGEELLGESTAKDASGWVELYKHQKSCRPFFPADIHLIG